jgi:hypothetical protein
MNDFKNVNSKLCIVDYFDKLTNTIDIDTEILIQKFYSSQEIKDKLNQLRCFYLNEIKRVELEYLKSEKMSKIKKVETNEFKLDGSFLFYIENVYLEKLFDCQNGILVAIDHWLNDDEILLFKYVKNWRVVRCEIALTS